MFTVLDIHERFGEDVLDTDEQKVGELDGIYIDSESKEAGFVAIKTGLFGTGRRLVPVKKDDVIQGVVRVGYAKEVVKGAPEVDFGDTLTPEVEQRIREYYGRHERREPEPLPPPGDILSQREATKGVDPESADFDIPDDAAQQTI